MNHIGKDPAPKEKSGSRMMGKFALIWKKLGASGDLFIKEPTCIQLVMGTSFIPLGEEKKKFFSKSRPEK